MEKLKHIIDALRYALKDMGISAKALLDLWEETDRVTINVVGDPIIDRYVDIEPKGIAKGYPIIKWDEVGSRDYAGGCLRVAKDCAFQCERVNLGFCGDGVPNTRAMLLMSEAKNIAFYGRGNPSTSLVEKIRYVYQNRQVFRLTTRHGYNLGAYPDVMGEANVTILSIFDVENPIEAKRLRELAGNSLLIIDSQNPEYIRRYTSDRTILFATEREFRESGCNLCDFRVVFLKNDINGSSVNGVHIPALNLQPVENMGAGDSYLATAAVVLGRHPSEYVLAGLMGAIASAIHCSKCGNATVKREEISHVLMQAGA